MPEPGLQVQLTGAVIDARAWTENRQTQTTSRETAVRVLLLQKADFLLLDL
jgi:hypothetical protein